MPLVGLHALRVFLISPNTITRAFSVRRCMEMPLGWNTKIHFMVEQIDEVIFIFKVLGGSICKIYHFSGLKILFQIVCNNFLKFVHSNCIMSQTV